MLFIYKSIDQQGNTQEGTIDAVSIEVAVSALQRRGLSIASITPADKKGGFLDKNLSFLERVSNKDIVILSRQMATLFEAQVSALRVFRLLADESENPALRRTLIEVSDDLQGGSSISAALQKHPKVFSVFYVNMVSAGEESGKLDQTFMFLADYLDRSFEVSSKARNALIYPAFIVATMFAVMLLMFTMVIPRIGAILVESGQVLPVYTQFIMGISNFLLNYYIPLIVILIGGGYALYRYVTTESGAKVLAHFKLSVPYLGTLYKRLYLSRIADNMNVMISSGISMVRVIEITASVVGNDVYADIMTRIADAVKAGSSLSDAFSANGGNEIPGIMIQMVRVGEETGELGSILKTLAKFYQREVEQAVDTLVDLIEPVMIVTLGIGVGFLLISVLVPIYNISSSF